MIKYIIPAIACSLGLLLGYSHGLNVGTVRMADKIIPLIETCLEIKITRTER